MMKIVILFAFFILFISACNNDDIEDNLSINNSLDNISDLVGNESLDLGNNTINDSLDNQTNETYVEVSCIDSDSGKEYDSWGYIKINGSKEYLDDCISESFIREYYCDDEYPGNLAFEVYRCDDYCLYGECNTDEEDNETDTNTS